MPELPEVETIKLGLSKKIVGKTIKNIDLLSKSSFHGEVEDIKGKKVEGIWRRGKILGIVLTGDTTLLFHLKMTGQLIWENQESRVKNQGRLVGGHPTTDMFGKLPNSHTRVIFTFSDGSKLYFNDQRRFGWVKLVTSTEVTSNKFLGSIGPEPLEKGFTWRILKSNLLIHKSQPVKVALMDPKVVAGIGNIYASEACFDAGLDPQSRVRDLSDEQIKRLHGGIIKSLKAGLKYGGATRAHFVDAEGHRGYFLDYAYVYGKDKHLCKICGTIIKKITLGGRGTYYCPKCQK